MFNLIVTNLSAQLRQSDNCLLIETLLKYSKARKTFKFDLYPDEPIRFIDNKGSINGCAINDYYNRRVIIEKDTSFGSQSNVSNIILYNITQQKRKYKVELQQKFTGAYGYILFKRTWNGFKVTDFMVGYF